MAASPADLRGHAQDEDPSGCLVEIWGRCYHKRISQASSHEIRSVRYMDIYIYTYMWDFTGNGNG